MRFVDGLRDDIKSIVMIQRPSTLDSAYALALVQEEALDSGRKKKLRCYEPFVNKMIHKPAFPLLSPPKLDKPATPSLAEDKHNIDVSQASLTDDKLTISSCSRSL
jgi:hypothetical protein